MGGAYQPEGVRVNMDWMFLYEIARVFAGGNTC